jgi:GNAT superfamily N-acetyltransferase
MNDDRHLMRLHIAALFTTDAAGRLLRVNEPAGGAAPRFFVGRTRDGSEWRVRDDVTDARLLRDLETAVESDGDADTTLAPPQFPTRYESILAGVVPVQRIWSGPAFHVPANLPTDSRPVHVTDANAEILRRFLSPWLPDVVTAQPLFALTVNGDAVAVCASVRITDAAHEAGVETVPEYRGRGYAGAVVSAWAAAVRRVGAQPLYSTSWQNVASQAVARKLGLRQFGADLHIT